MAVGEQDGRAVARGDQSESERLAHGEAVVGSGRISAARRVTPVLDTLPFTRSELARLERALNDATAETGLHVSVYLGDLGPHPREQAAELLDSLGDDAPYAVLVAVSPGERHVEVVLGTAAHRRIPDRVCAQAVTSMVGSFERGDLAGGVVAGLAVLAEHAPS